MNINKAWMYSRLKNGFITEEYMNGVEDFVNFAKNHPECMDGDKLRCPCIQRKCRNTTYRDEDTIKVHLGKYGFVPNYYNWYVHGEPYVIEPIGHSIHSSSAPIAQEDPSIDNTMQSMIHDAVNACHHSNVDEIPTPTVQNLYEMLKASEREVWEGIPSGHSQLSAVARLLNIKAEHHFSERCYDDICQLMSELLPTNNIMTDSFYNTKKLVKGLGLPVEKIDCCINNCMIFWKDDVDLAECKMCCHPRYRPHKHGPGKNKKKISWKIMYYFSLTPRLQRLYASTATAKHMRWHHEHVHGGDIMCHPSDSAAWKHLDGKYPFFAMELRNVRLGLSADGFQPFGQSGKQYSSWPVILDNMTAKVTETTQASIDGDEPHTPSQDEINNIYFDVVGGMKKSRLYGLGSQAKVMFPHAMSTSTGNGRRSISSTAIEELRTENAELKARMVELEKTTAENSELRARMADLEEKMRRFMSRMVFSQTLANPSAFPDYSSPIIDSDETQP